MTTYTWVLSAGTVGSWASAGDWSPSGVPQTGDNSILTDGGTILLSVGSVTGNTLYLGDGELIFAGGTSSIGSTTAIISTGDAGSIIALGTLINAGTIEVGAGDALIISVGTSAELLNTGQIIADGGIVTIDASIYAIDGGYGVASGLAEITNDGTLEINIPYVPSPATQVPIIALDDASVGNTLKLDNANLAGLQVFGFQQGDTIDFGTSFSAGTLFYNDGAFGTSLGLFEIAKSPGVGLAAVDFVSGAMPAGIAAITFTDGTAVADGFTLTTSGGDTLLTTSAVNDTVDTGGVWQDVGLWSDGVPGTADTAIIGQDALSAFTLSTGGPATPVTVAGLSVVGPDATLSITNAVSVTSLPVIDMGGSIEVADGGTLSTPNVEMPSAGVVAVDAGGTLAVTLGVLPGSPSQENIDSGTLLVDGLFSDAGAFQLGQDASSQPALVTVNGGTLHIAQFVVIDGGSTIALNGATMSAGQVVVGDGSAGMLLLQDSTITDRGSGLVAGYSPGGSGTIALDNSAVRLGLGAELDLGGAANTSGVMTLSGGSTLTAGQYSIGESGSGTLIVNSGALVNAVASYVGLSLGISPTGSGTLIVDGGIVNFGTAGIGVGVQGTGSISVESGLLICGGLGIAGSDEVSIGSGGTVYASTVFAGSPGVGIGGVIDLSGGVLNALAGVLIDTFSTIRGYGTIDGNVDVADSTSTVVVSGGTLAITGSVTGTGGKLLIESGSALALAGLMGSGQSIEFDDDGATLQADGSMGNEDDPGMVFADSASPETLILNTPGASFTNAITGINNGDRIEFGDGMTITSAQVINSSTIVAHVTSGGTTGTYDLTNASFAAGSSQQLFAGVDASTGDSYVQVGTLSWAIDAPGNFDDPTRWTGTSVPSAATDATIAFADDPQVLHSSGSDTVNSLTNTAGDFVMSGGTLAATTLTNNSLMSWTGGSIVLNRTATAASLSNTGTFTIAPNSQRLSIIGTANFNNTGTITTAGALGVAYIDAPLTNNGEIIVNQGTLSLNSGGSSNGAGLQGGTGGVLQFGLPDSGIGNTFSITGGEYAVGNTAIDGGRSTYPPPPGCSS